MYCISIYIYTLDISFLIIYLSLNIIIATSFLIPLLHIPTSYPYYIYPPPNGSRPQISKFSHLQMAATLKYQHVLTSKWQPPSNINIFPPPDGSYPQISTYSYLQIVATLKYQHIPTSKWQLPSTTYSHLHMAATLKGRGGSAAWGGLMFERSSKVQQIWYSCSSRF